MKCLRVGEIGGVRSGRCGFVENILYVEIVWISGNILFLERMEDESGNVVNDDDDEDGEDGGEDGGEDWN